MASIAFWSALSNQATKQHIHWVPELGPQWIKEATIAVLSKEMTYYSLSPLRI